MKLPLKFNAGTSLSFSFKHKKTATGWRFFYALRGCSVIDIDVECTATDCEVKVPASETRSWIAGEYEWQLFAEKENEKIKLDQGFITIEPDFSSITGSMDVRSHARKMLDSINKILEGRILSDHEKYSIQGRSLDRIPILELYKLRTAYARKIHSEEKGGKFKIKRVLTRFK